MWMYVFITILLKACVEVIVLMLSKWFNVLNPTTPQAKKGTAFVGYDNNLITW
jgi:hypothetical protein